MMSGQVAPLLSIFAKKAEVVVLHLFKMLVNIQLGWMGGEQSEQNFHSLLCKINGAQSPYISRQRLNLFISLEVFMKWTQTAFSLCCCHQGLLFDQNLKIKLTRRNSWQRFYFVLLSTTTKKTTMTTNPNRYNGSMISYCMLFTTLQTWTSFFCSTSRRIIIHHQLNMTLFALSFA